MRSPIFQSLPRIMDETITPDTLFEAVVRRFLDDAARAGHSCQRGASHSEAATVISLSSAPSTPPAQQRALLLLHPADSAS